VPQFGGILFGLRAHVALEDRALGRVIPGAVNSQQVLELDLRLREIGEQFGGGDGGAAVNRVGPDLTDAINVSFFRRLELHINVLRRALLDFDG
jgi:hypothetical protein